MQRKLPLLCSADHFVEEIPELSLAKARAKAKSVLGEVADGRDPAEEKQVERRAETFGELAREYLERHAKPKKRSWREDERILNREILPNWRHIKAKSLKRAHVRQLLNRIMDRGSPIQANRTFALVRKIFNYSLSIDFVPDDKPNPCKGLARPGEEKQRDRVLSADEIRTLWDSLPDRRPQTAAIVKLFLLTAQRVGEVLSMRWADVDLEQGWWPIPAEISKNKKPHRVPLSPQAHSILQELHALRDDCPFVFPSTGARGSQVTIKKTIRLTRQSLKIDFTPHDLRRTAASLMTGMGVSRLTVAPKPRRTGRHGRL